LHRDHEVTVYEAGSHIGGHTHTHALEHEGERYQVDSGCIVFNEHNYAGFTALLDELKVASPPGTM
jgi:hypothetical protein